MSWVGDRARRAVLGWLSQRAVQQGNGVNWLTGILQALMGGQKTSAGVYVNEENALRISAVFTAVRIIGGTFGSLPRHVYRRTDDGGRELAVRHWAYPLLHDAPSADHTAFTWGELTVAHILLWGNSYHRIEWLRNGAAGELLPLMPWCVTPRKTKGGTKYYEVQLADGYEDLPADEVLHFPGVGYDGMRGVSVIEKMRDALGIAKAAEDLVGSFFANGAKVGGVLEVPGKMDPQAQKNLVESLAKEFTGRDGAFKTVVLEEGAKLHGPNMMPLKDAQMLESRKFSRTEIFGWYGVPPHLGGDSEKSTSWGTGIEQMDIGYAKHTITPICVRVEQELNRKLFVRGSGLYVKHNMDALVRGDFKSLMEGLQIATGRPILTGNEARELLDWNKSSQADMNKVALPLNTGAGAAPKKPGQGDDDPGEGGEPEGNSRRGGPGGSPVSVVVNNNLPAPEVKVAAPSVSVSNNVPPAPAPHVEVHNQVLVPEQPRPIVQVAAPEVRNEVRVDMPPAEVNVHLPPRKSVSEIERDANRDITRVTQIEKDA